MKGSGKMGKEIVKEFLNFRMETYLKAAQKIIKDKVKVFRNGKITQKQKNKLVFFLNMLFLSILENGKMTK